MPEARRTFYPLRLAQEASAITAFKDTHQAASTVNNDLFEYLIITGPFALFMAASEFALPATMRFIRENGNGNDEYRSLRTLLLSVGAIATDIVTNGLIIAAGVDSPINVPARRIVLNYATHLGIDFIQKVFPDRHIPRFAERPTKTMGDIPQPNRVARTKHPEARPVTEKPKRSIITHSAPKTPVLQSTNVIKPDIEEPLIPVGDILVIKTQERGLLLREETGELKIDPEGRIFAEFPGPPKYTARIPQSLIGTKYQMVDDKTNVVEQTYYHFREFIKRYLTSH